MRSTGEVLGLSKTVGGAFFRAQEATQTKLPTSGSVLISVNNKEKAEVAEVAENFKKAGFKIYATEGTHKLLAEHGIESEHVLKRHEGRPNIEDMIYNNQIDIVINSPVGADSKIDDSYLRKAAIKAKIAYVTNIAAAKAAVDGILDAEKEGTGEVHSLQSLHAMIKEK